MEEEKGKTWSYYWNELKFSFVSSLFYRWWEPLEILYYNCRRIIQWLPIIWKDNNGDFDSIITILKHKVTFNRKALEKAEFLENADELAQQMRVVELVLQRLEDPWKYTEKEWKDYTKNRQATKDSSKELRRAIKQIQYKELYMFKQDLEYLAKCLHKNLRKWYI